MEPRKDPLLGAQVGEYVIEERIGLGGMGVVYRAAQPKIGKKVAIKVLRADVMEDPREMERFLDEARSVNAISHRGIISIFGAGELPDGRQYLVMEYLKGESLEDKLKRDGRIPAAEVVPLLEEVLAALQGVHAAGIIHRDLKPANVFLVEQSDGRPWVKVLDFGLARRGERTDVSRIAGTPDYLSPEHARGLPVSPASDLYSFGVMAFHLLTGQLPFSGRSALEVMQQHVYTEPPNPMGLEPGIPPALGELILALMRKEPNARPKLPAVRSAMKAVEKDLKSQATSSAPRLSAEAVRAARMRAMGSDEKTATGQALDTLPPDAPPAPGADGVPALATLAAGGEQAPAPVFEALPRALQGTLPAEGGPDTAGLTPMVDRRSRAIIFVGLGTVGVILLAVLAWTLTGPRVAAIDMQRSSSNAIKVNVTVDHEPGTETPPPPPSTTPDETDPEAQDLAQDFANPMAQATDAGP